MVKVASAAGATAAVTLHRARHQSPYAPVLERVDIPMPSDASGPALRIGFVTDTHIGSVMRARDVDRALELLFTAAPDLLLLGGDYVCESPRFVDEAATVFGPYASSAPLGAFAVLGNHDYSNDAARMTRGLERQAIRVLRNAAAPVCAAAGELWIVGVDDAMLGFPDPAEAFAGVPERAPVIALWHEPDWADAVAPYGAFLQLSGHSHGGQIRLPFVGSIAAPAGGRRFVAGLNMASGMRVYTSRGVGVYRPPIRIRCRPEVTLLTLAGYDEKAGDAGHPDESRRD